MIVRAKHIEGLQFELTSMDSTIISDQWEDYGGDGMGPMPSELFLWSVAACFGQAVAHVAKKMRQPVANLNLKVDGIKSTDSFQYGSITVTVNGECPEEKLNKIVELAKKYCFVTNSLSPQVKLSFMVGQNGD